MFISVPSISNRAFEYWSGSDAFNDNSDVSMTLFNEGMFYGILLESIPQLVIQIINNFKTDTWSGIAILSAAASSVCLFSVLYRYVYYIFYLKMNVADVPIVAIKDDVLRSKGANNAVKTEDIYTQFIDNPMSSADVELRDTFSNATSSFNKEASIEEFVSKDEMTKEIKIEMAKMKVEMTSRIDFMQQSMQLSIEELKSLIHKD